MNMEGGSEESWADLQKIIWDCKTDDQGDGILASDS